MINKYHSNESNLKQSSDDNGPVHVTRGADDVLGAELNAAPRIKPACVSHTVDESEDETQTSSLVMQRSFSSGARASP